MSELSRRDFLKLARDGFLYLSGAMMLGGLVKFLDYDPNPAPQTEFNLGAAEKYPPGSHTSIAEIPALLIHSAQGFVAISLTCTHLGCTVEHHTDGFACPCHGSQYDAHGNVTQGPAASPLKRLRIEITKNNELILYKD
jgi:Rieske Fe-S protein